MGNPCISESQEGKSLWYKQRVQKFIMEPFKSRLANFTLMKLADCGFLPTIFADLKVRTRNRRSADILARIANSVQKFQWVIELACRWQSSFYAGRYVAVMLPLIFGFRHSSKVGKHFANCRPCGSALQHETHINLSKDRKLWLKSKHHCSGWRKQAKHIFICLFDNNLYNRIFQSQSNPELKG